VISMACAKAEAQFSTLRLNQCWERASITEDTEMAHEIR
jgi:hypothetical protein